MNHKLPTAFAEFTVPYGSIFACENPTVICSTGKNPIHIFEISQGLPPSFLDSIHFQDKYLPYLHVIFTYKSIYIYMCIYIYVYISVVICFKFSPNKKQFWSIHALPCLPSLWLPWGRQRRNRRCRHTGKRRRFSAKIEGNLLERWAFGKKCNDRICGWL